MPEAIPVACGVLQRGGKVLAAKRNRNSSLGGLWEFAGGKVEPGESPEDAIVREWKEELGITVRVIEPLSRIATQADTQPIALIPFLLDADPSEEPKALEHEDIRWVNREEARELNWVPGDIPILESLSF